MCKSLQPKEGFFEGNFQKAMKSFDLNNDGLVDFDEFISITKNYPLAFYPIFNFQESVKKHTLGRSTWEKIIKRKLKVDGLLKYMRRHLGRQPAPTIFEKFFGKYSQDTQLRLTAKKLYDEEMKNKIKK